MIRFGVVGFGLHAERRLMPGFLQSEKCSVSAISRRDRDKAIQSAEEYGVPHAFISTEELCGCEEVDAIFVTSPDALHHFDVLCAIEHGKPVICEKPMAMNGREAAEMVKAAENAEVLLGVAHVFRFEHSTRRFRERIAAGDIGRPVLARSDFCYSVTGHGRRWIYDPELACGGPIADVGVHCIDALRFVLDDEVVSVQTEAVTDEASRPFESTAIISLAFGSGAIGTVSVSTRSDYRTVLEVIGEEGTLIANDGLNVERPLVIEFSRGTGSGDAQYEEVVNLDAYSKQVDAFASAMESDTLFEVPGREGLINQLILDAAYSSWKSGKRENVESPD